MGGRTPAAISAAATAAPTTRPRMIVTRTFGQCPCNGQSPSTSAAITAPPWRHRRHSVHCISGPQFAFLLGADGDEVAPRVLPDQTRDLSWNGNRLSGARYPT